MKSIRIGAGARKYVRPVIAVYSTTISREAIEAGMQAKVTAAVVKKHFEGLVTGDVIRYDIPSLHGFNFVLNGVRKGGVSAALDSDVHGKSLSFGLLELDIDIA